MSPHLYVKYTSSNYLTRLYSICDRWGDYLDGYHVTLRFCHDTIWYLEIQTPAFGVATQASYLSVLILCRDPQAPVSDLWGWSYNISVVCMLGPDGCHENSHENSVT